MFFLTRPSPEQVARIVESCARRTPNHEALPTADLARPPHGFARDEYGAELGSGEVVWRAARDAIDNGLMYPPAWTAVCTAPGKPAVGAPFVSLIRHFGFHSVLPGRIREGIDSDGQAKRYGFSFLTLEGHAEQGVERFVVSWDGATDVVRYDATAISRPAGIVRLGRPLARHLQRRFQRDSVASMRRATATS